MWWGGLSGRLVWERPHFYKGEVQTGAWKGVTRERVSCKGRGAIYERRGRGLGVSRSEWIYDWNAGGAMTIPPGRHVMVNDETLRDGLQTPSVTDPSIEEKIEILHLMEALHIDSVNLGLPGAGARVAETVERLAREIATNHMRIRPNCAARTVEADIRPIVEISQKVGIAIEAAMFLGSSPIRRLVEDWTVEHLERTTEKAVKFAVAHGLPAMYVTEDTVRTDPDTVQRLYTTAIHNGARAIVLCDTVGHATPQGAFNLVKFAFEKVVSLRERRFAWIGTGTGIAGCRWRIRWRRWRRERTKYMGWRCRWGSEWGIRR